MCVCVCVCVCVCIYVIVCLLSIFGKNVMFRSTSVLLLPSLSIACTETVTVVVRATLNDIVTDGLLTISILTSPSISMG